MTTSSSPGLSIMPATRRNILDRVKRSGEAATEEIAAALGITPQATRQHLTGLERDGLLQHRELRDGMGRPKFLYSLTSTADTLFPRRYDDLANELLEYVRDEDPEMLERIFDRRAQRRLAGAVERTRDLPFAEKVQMIAEILDGDGYLADFERMEDGTYVITERNCAVLSVALKYGHACGSELDFLQAAIPEAEVTRIAHRVAGGHVCAYHVTPRGDV